MNTKFEAERKARQEAEDARFNALSQEEKLAELKTKLAGVEEFIMSIRKGRNEVSRWILDSKAYLERKIAEYSTAQDLDRPVGRSKNPDGGASATY